MINFNEKWYLQVFDSELYNNDSLVDFSLYNTNINDWELLINKLKKEFKIVAKNFNGRSLPDDFKIKTILESENKTDFFIEIYLKNIKLRLYTNSAEIIEGDIQRTEIENIEYFVEFTLFLKDISAFLLKKIYIYDEMNEEKPIFIINNE